MTTNTRNYTVSPHMPMRMRIYIGVRPETRLASKVLECSIIRRTEWPTDIIYISNEPCTWTYNTNNLIPECDAYNLRKWLVPYHAHWNGLALYIDAASVVLDDIWDLWTQPQQTSTQNKSIVWCPYLKDKPNTNLMLIDCIKAKTQWGFNRISMLNYLRTDQQGFYSFQQGMWLNPQPAKIAESWMHLDLYEKDKTKLIYFENNSLLPYPWQHSLHPCTQIWEKEFMIAIKTGMLPLGILEEELNNNNIHPSFACFLDSKSAKKRIA